LTDVQGGEDYTCFQAGAQHHSPNVVAHRVCADAQVLSDLFIGLNRSE
jgi:hypothetical protein